MKFIELSLLVVFMGMFGKAYGSTFLRTMESAERKMDLQRRADSYEFISESFRASCDGYGFSSLDEWKDTVTVMWKIDELEIEKKDGVYHMSWKCPDSEGEIFHGVKKYESKTEYGRL